MTCATFRQIKIRCAHSANGFARCLKIHCVHVANGFARCLKIHCVHVANEMPLLPLQATPLLKIRKHIDKIEKHIVNDISSLPLRINPLLKRRVGESFCFAAGNDLAYVHVKGGGKMNKVYQEIAESFERLSKCYGELAKAESRSENKGLSVTEEVTVEQIREVLSKKSQEGKTEEVKALLMKFGVEKLSNVKGEDYKDLLRDASKL